jgi:MarR family transcriptional regulator, 2-MHQ and catechol-resistance regulon repressor
MPTHYQGSPEEQQALDTYIKLMRAAQSVTKRVHKHLGRWKLTTGQFGVLDALYHLGPCFQQALARKHLVSPGNIVMVVDNLEKRCLVERRRSGKDRRMMEVHLTASGTALFEQVFPEHVTRIVQQLGVLSELEQRALSELAKKLGLRESGVKHDELTPVITREKAAGTTRS